MATINTAILGRPVTLEVDPAEFDARLESFIARAQALITDHATKHLPALVANNLVDIVEFTRGGRYIRVTHRQPSQRGGSAYVFIDTKPETLGNIYKPASYKAPAKHARGNLFAADGGMGAIGVYGATYMR